MRTKDQLTPEQVEQRRALSVPVTDLVIDGRGVLVIGRAPVAAYDVVINIPLESVIALAQAIMTQGALSLQSSSVRVQ